jgi:serpin B
MPILKNMMRALLALSTGTAAMGADRSAVEPPSDVAALAKGNNRFALNLYGQLSSREGNIFLSPFSISTALAMTYGGAGGETAQEMNAALEFPFAGARLHPAFAALIKQIHGDKSQDYQLNIANGLWTQRGHAFRKEFKSLVKTHYGAELRELDFAAASEKSRGIINQWVEKQTEAKIRDLIPPGAITALTRLILSNAIYFRGQWIDPFEKEATKDAPFKVTPGQEITVPMMFQQEHFQYLETRSFQALRLLYKGGDLAMIVLLPRRVDGLGELEKSLSAENLDKWLGELGGREVKVYLPKFRVESSFTLNDTLGAMGIRRAFDAAAADFSGMTGAKELSISLVIHKAFVDVDERGTEAAAATAIGMALAAPPGEEGSPAVFRADHPFLFLIRDQRSGSILFLGRVTNPKS